MVALFWIVVEPLRGGVSVEEVSPWDRPWGFISRLCIQTCVTEEQPYETCVSTSPQWGPYCQARASIPHAPSLLTCGEA